jgi:SAM-dependent MidA family methyltransferase
MSGGIGLVEVLGNMLEYSDLSFHDFMEIALYHPQLGYYSQRRSPVGKEGDYVTSPAISPVFVHCLNGLIREFMIRTDDAACSIVDIGCGDGSLIHSLYAAAPADVRERATFCGVDRSLERVVAQAGVAFATQLETLPPTDFQLLISNELFDSFPFARLVMRDEHLHELWVTDRDGTLDWMEHEAEPRYDDYFAERGIELRDGQFADLALEWEATYEDICRFVTRGLIVTFDYGYPEQQLFSGSARRFGTAAAYANQKVSRDLLGNPGQQDLTAHINFTDLQRAGDRSGFRTLFFDRQARFLLSLGATQHELLAPLDQLKVDSVDDALRMREEREDARRLVLPDGIGEEIRVLVQGRGMGEGEWSFQKRLF